MTRHCPTCTCGKAAPVVPDTHAPFFPLVLLIDRLTNDAHGKSLRRNQLEETPA